MQTTRKFISLFSPNRTAPEDLERINVQRQDLLERSVAVLRESALTENKHHLLFVGPRGCGKTHLIHLIFHRLQQQPDLAEPLRIAWLSEDETSTSFLDLLLRIYRALSERYPAEFPAAEMECLAGRTRAEAVELLGNALVSRIGRRTALVLIENLDALFHQLDEADQRAWRAFIQNHPVFATVATAQSLFAGVSDRDQPFFGFFDTTHLQPLTAAQAAELLRLIANLNHDDELARFLETPRGKARIQAIHHLSGGNHRLYIILSDFITRESLDQLVGPFERMVDERLTPYYQERLRWLSPQQRKIVEFLCQRARPAPVKEIAAALFAEHGSITSQLQKLREMGYVRPNPRGRESLYELAEPLMRLSLDVKNTGNAQPLRVIVDFLRVWFDRDELERLSTHCVAAGLGVKYLSAALEKLQPGQPNLRRELLLQGLEDLDLEHCSHDQLEQLRSLAEESSDPEDWMKCAVACYFHRQFPEAAGWIGKVVELPGAPVEMIANALFSRGVSLGELGRTQEAIADYTRAIELFGAPVVSVAKALVNRGVRLRALGRPQEEIADYTRAIELPGAPADQVAKALVNRGFALGALGRPQEEIADYIRAIELPGAPVEIVANAFVNRGVTLGMLGRAQEEIADYTRAIELAGAPPEPVANALFNRGLTFGMLGRIQEEIADYTRVIDMPGAPVKPVANALFNRGVRLGMLSRTQEEIADYARAIELPGAPPEPIASALFNRGISLGSLGRRREAVADYTRAIELPGTPPDLVAKALVQRGASLLILGQTQEAVADYTHAIALSGAPPEQVARARAGIVCSRLVTGEWSALVAQLESFLAESLKPGPVVALVSEAVLEAIFGQIGSPEVRRARTITAVLLYARYDALSKLGEALVRHLSKLSKSPLNSDGLDQWLAGWESAASDHAEMQVPLRLLRAGIAYLKTSPRDEAVLLQLPSEERSLVRLALGLPEESTP